MLLLKTLKLYISQHNSDPLISNNLFNDMINPNQVDVMSVKQTLILKVLTKYDL